LGIPSPIAADEDRSALPSRLEGTNVVRRELGLPVTTVRAVDPALQIDIVPKTPDR
jgi:hypothetical protein